MASAVYILCAITSLACSALLLRAHRSSRVELLLWSAICFLGLALNNMILLIDLTLVPSIDLSMWRKVPAVVGVSFLVYGLVMHSR